MSKFIAVTGSPDKGIVAMTDDGQVCFLARGSTQWRDAPPFRGELQATVSAACNGESLAVATGKVVSYLTSYGSEAATWKPIGGNLEDDAVAVVGEPVTAFIVLDNKGKLKHKVASGRASSWNPLPPAPPSFGGTVKLLAGDSNGLLIVGGPKSNQVARRGADGDSWTALPPSPFRIDAACGNAVNGFVVFGEGQLAQLDTMAGWKVLPRPSFVITALSGNPTDGVVALTGQGTVLASCRDLLKGGWEIAKIVQAQATGAGSA